MVELKSDVFNPEHSNMCIIPWMSFQLDAQGKYNVCCIHKGKKRDNLDFTDVKDRMLSGEKLPECNKCWYLESKKIQSRREIFWNNYKDIFDPADEKILHADISLGNICNLACTMCNSYSSSKWYAIEKDMNKDHTKLFLPHTHDLNLILDSLNGIDYIEILGGEPFYQKDSELFFNHIVSEKVTIEITTNGTIIPDWFINLIPKFKKVIVQCSQEGIGKVYEYIRGSSFSIFEENIKLLKKSNVILRVNQTIFNCGIFNISEMTNWNENIMVKNYFKMLVLPKYLSISTIPLEYREEILSNLDSEKHKEVFKIFENKFWDEENYQNFKKYIRTIDKIKNTNLLDTVPQFKEIFRKY